ncbi:MAG: transglycosylase domain-containing protein, partial [Carboxydocellales bacterium]
MGHKAQRSKVSFKQLVLGVILLIIFSLLAVGAMVTGLGMAFYEQYKYQWVNGDLVAASNTMVYDRTGKLIAQLHGPENRVVVKYDHIPQQLKDAFLAVEDVRFYDHPGLDVIGIARAALVDIREEELSQGGSTITQQLARNAFLSKEKTWQRKLKELVMARELELRYSKDEILGMYLNRIYFGHGVYGVQAASRLYYGKDVDKLKPAEAALLAGIAKNPGLYSPYRNMQAATIRRNLVLTLMEGYGLIPPMDADKARAAAVQVVGLRSLAGYRFPYYVDQVIREARDRYGIEEEQLYTGGYSIYSSLDPKVQGAAEAVLADGSQFPPGVDGVPVQGAIAVVDYHLGEVRALVGGRDYPTVRAFNRATQLKRQPGSTIKPLVVYAPALEKGYPVSYRLDDSITALGGYRPQNYGGHSYGSMDMTFALRNSVNVYAVKLLKEIGVNSGFRMGVGLGLPLVEGDRNLSLALGGLTGGVSPYQMAAAFGTFGAEGIYREPTTIIRLVGSNGLEIKGKKLRVEQVITGDTAQKMTGLLEEVVNSGTGREARLTVVAAVYRQADKFSAAGKTGTTQLPDTPEFRGIKGNKDAWFVGYT